MADVETEHTLMNPPESSAEAVVTQTSSIAYASAVHSASVVRSAVSPSSTPPSCKSKSARVRRHRWTG